MENVALRAGSVVHGAEISLAGIFSYRRSHAPGISSVVNHLAGHASINGYDGTVDEIVGRMSQKPHYAGNIFRRAYAP